MGVEQKIFHLVIEVLAIIISVYFLYLSRKFSGWKKYALIIIATGVIIIDIYAILTWTIGLELIAKKWFHIITEALAIPAGIILIYLSTRKINDVWGSRVLLTMGLAKIIVDGILIFTWL